MITIKNKKLFAVCLTLAVVLCLPVAFAKAESTDKSNAEDNQNKVIENSINTNTNTNTSTSTTSGEYKNKIDEGGIDENGNAQFTGDEHRSSVSTFVQNLLKVADKEKGKIGDEVKAIAKDQNDNKDNVANNIDKIKNRGGFKTFLIGTDYKNIGQLRSEMVKTGNQIDQLNKLLSQTTNADTKVALDAQIKTLQQEQQKINDFLKANESKFSLFGWFVKLFNK